MYGCLPPWWPLKNNITCEKDLPVKQIKEDDLTKTIYHIIDLDDGFNIDIMKHCLAPCVAQKVDVICEYSQTNFPRHAVLRLTIPSKITMTKAMYHLSPWYLVVEFGSALGLWLGYSVLNLFDVGLILLGHFKIALQKVYQRHK